jgi:gas vesicle protein
VAKDNSGGFLAGLVVGGLVGAALALVYTPRSGRDARAVLAQGASSLWGGNAETLLEQGRAALRSRFEAATAEAQQAASATEQRLEQEYRGATHGS